MKCIKKTLIGTAISLIFAAHSAPIVIGHTAPFSGASAVAGNQLREGIEVAIKEQNANGGINGLKIELVALDDEHDSEKTVKNIKYLSEKHNASIIVSTFGNAQSIAAANQIEIQKIPLIGPISGIELLRSKSFSYVFNVRSSYECETKKLIEYMSVATNPNKQFALVYADTVYGKDVKNIFLSELLKKNANPPVEIKLDQKTTEKAAAAAIKQLKATDVIIAANIDSIIKFKNELATLEVKPQVGTLSYVGPVNPGKAMMSQISGLVITQVMPGPDEVYVPFIKKYQLAMKKYSSEKFSHNSLESYVSTLVGIEAMKTVKGEVTSDKIYDSLSRMKIDFGGYKIDYTNNQHNGSSRCSITAIARNGELIQ